MKSATFPDRTASRKPTLSRRGHGNLSEIDVFFTGKIQMPYSSVFLQVTNHTEFHPSRARSFLICRRLFCLTGKRAPPVQEYRPSRTLSCPGSSPFSRRLIASSIPEPSLSPAASESFRIRSAACLGSSSFIFSASLPSI